MPTSSGSSWDGAPSRRRFLIGGGSLGLTLLTAAGCSSGSADTAANIANATLPDAKSKSATSSLAGVTPTTAGTQVCLLTPELTAGPYYLDGALIRRDITEGVAGLPMNLEFTVIDSRSCQALVGAAVDVWHCDADGEYSGFNGNTLAETSQNGRNNKTYLRGVQLTDDDGLAKFKTIYPGWYQGRAIHIHLKVLLGGSAGKTYDEGHVAHVGQTFFSDATSEKVMSLDAYSAHNGDRTTNAQDSIFGEQGELSLMELTPNDSNDLSKGISARIGLSVDPSATP